MRNDNLANISHKERKKQITKRIRAKNCIHLGTTNAIDSKFKCFSAFYFWHYKYLVESFSQSLLSLSLSFAHSLAFFATAWKHLWKYSVTKDDRLFSFSSNFVGKKRTYKYADLLDYTLCGQRMCVIVCAKFAQEHKK